MKKIIDFLEQCRLAKKQFFQNLTVFPLIGPELFEPFYLTLEEALSDGCIQLLELDEEGTVSDVRLVNRSEKPVLIIEGEAIAGAKQNRIMNATFLIAGTVKVVLPVSCVEQGRWRRDTHQFHHSKKIMNPSLRRETKASVMDSLKQGRGYRSDQGRVWDDIAEKSQQLCVNSPTMAMTDVFETYESRLKDYEGRFLCVENQLGAVFAIGGQVCGAEAFGCAETYRHFHKKLVQSYALDALDKDVLDENEKEGISVPPSKARNFLESVVKATGERHPSISLGDTIAIESKTTVGSSLVYDGKTLHLAVFRKVAGRESENHMFERFSRRRRFYD